MIYANGIKKSGTHLLQKYLKTLGKESVVHHAAYREIEHDAEHHFIVRDPRNVICSWVRWRGRPVNEETIIEAIETFQDGFSFVKYCQRFVPWLTDKETTLHCFELLSAIPSLHGGTPTYTANLVDWSLSWTDAVDIEWRAKGCADLQLAMGY